MARISLSCSFTLPSAVTISQAMAKSVSRKFSEICGADCSIRILLPCSDCRESALMVSSFKEELLNFELSTSILDNCSICDSCNCLPPCIAQANKMVTAASCSFSIAGFMLRVLPKSRQQKDAPAPDLQQWNEIELFVQYLSKESYEIWSLTRRVAFFC